MGEPHGRHRHLFSLAFSSQLTIVSQESGNRSAVWRIFGMRRRGAQEWRGARQSAAGDAWTRGCARRQMPQVPGRDMGRVSRSYNRIPHAIRRTGTGERERDTTLAPARAAVLP
eukprot:scaffold12445_cov107-Isochrysis_galbana.AAC.1